MAAYLGPLALLVVVLAAVTMLFLTSLLLTGQREPVRVEPFLSGRAPAEHAVSRFHPRWYAVALLFLAFDMEMVFMYPWAVVFAATGLKALVEMGVFLLILIVGVLYAWREGALRWT